MKKLLTIICLLAGLSATAQMRTYSDNESKTFIIGLESYFFGESGTLDFSIGKADFKASLSSGAVSINGQELETGDGDTVIGVHDFTGNRAQDLVVARRKDGGVYANVYSLTGGEWKLVGKVGSPAATEIRVFRQVLSIRSGSALLSWTWHGNKFDYKASDGSSEPVL
ncbi:MAG: hypothetical protein IJU21_01090 [Bacteroidales bacterium]|nr:hypothetical protein [Bacteroidales bacterium]